MASQFGIIVLDYVEAHFGQVILVMVRILSLVIARQLSHPTHGRQDAIGGGLLRNGRPCLQLKSNTAGLHENGLHWFTAFWSSLVSEGGLMHTRGQVLFQSFLTGEKVIQRQHQVSDAQCRHRLPRYLHPPTSHNLQSHKILEVVCLICKDGHCQVVQTQGQ